jgi:hypothetical protein
VLQEAARRGEPVKDLGNRVALGLGEGLAELAKRIEVRRDA